MAGIPNVSDITLPRDPVEDMHAATKRYVDQQMDSVTDDIGAAAKCGIEGELSGSPTLLPTNEAVKKYVDGKGTSGSGQPALFQVAHYTDLRRLKGAVPGDWAYAAPIQNDTERRSGLYYLLPSTGSYLNWLQVSYMEVR